MFSYIVRRLLYTVPIVFGVMLITFVLFNLVRGDITNQLAGEYADAETRAEIQKEFGLDKALFFDAKQSPLTKEFWDSQFFNHLISAVKFDFGYSFNDRELIWDKIKRGAGPSLALTVPMLFGTLALSISLSLIVAYFRGRWVDHIIVLLSITGMSLPFLSFILFGQYFLAFKLGLFPVYFWLDLSVWQYTALPIFIGIAAGLGSNLRFYRTVMLDEFRNDYVRTAFAKGLSTHKVLFKHVLKNAMIPIITQVVMAIPFLFLGSLLLERFFGIPGLGYLMIEAIASRDFQVINAMTYIGAILFVVFNIITDICYSLVDPRIRLE
ncbi:MAG: ABC transporter permease [Planctomycetes bacterium]|nr:ABC transporter permease [Planctomycetota bacterium]